ncbi:hypothetical protein [Streptomyces sp. NPDC021212]|uniref:hypothetical protein n=1 Tax=Streptomyces sp. NPDC021212 TaxID=3365118 RepID=UPI0037B8C5C4
MKMQDRTAQTRTTRGGGTAPPTVEVRASGFGLKRCHYVTAEGSEFQLIPDPASAEGRRGRFDRSHPALSRWFGFLSVIVLVIGVVLLILQLAEQVTRDAERALRMRHNWLLDGTAG